MTAAAPARTRAFSQHHQQHLAAWAVLAAQQDAANLLMMQTDGDLDEWGVAA